MGLFKNNTSQGAPLSPQATLLQRYNGSRNNLIFVVAFTLVNMVMLIAGSSSYFLFSSSIPYYLTFFGMYHTGKLSADYYYGETEFEPLATSFLVITVVISLVIVAIYGVCWLMSKKHGFGWLIFALISFGIDTIFMFSFEGFSADMILDIIFHVWVIFSLCSGISAAVKLNKLPPQEGIAESYQGGVPVMAEVPILNNTPAEPISTTERSNELLEETVNDISKED